MPPTLSQQVLILTRYIGGLHPNDVDDDIKAKVLSWIRDLPPEGRPVELLRSAASKLKVSDKEMQVALVKDIYKLEFDALVPDIGWLHDYMEYTRNTEPPSVFHFFAGLSAIGSALARNVFYDMGAYQIFPNLCVVIIAPSGKCRKTSACNVATRLFRAIGGNVLADKVTPEALVNAFRDKSSATGLIYAPELAVFLGRQKYNEGMVPLLTALFDCPKEWTDSTIMRGDTQLHNVALSFLVCSTMDWIQSAIPKDAFGGGFMSRLLFVVQADTPRVFPHPPPLSLELEASLKSKLFGYSKLKGQFKITPEADEWYCKWYMKKTESIATDKQFAGYVERKPDHLHRIAMILAISQWDSDIHHELCLTLPLMQSSLRILDWVEGHLPSAFAEMSQTSVGEEHIRMLKQLKAKGGVYNHADWLRLNTNRMNKQQFKEAVGTLREAKLVDYDSVKRQYLLTPEGWHKV